jgi:hypothetical protein
MEIKKIKEINKMEPLNESLSKKFDYSFCIEKETSRHYLYNAAEQVIEIIIDNSMMETEVIDTLSLWFQHISSQLICDIQKFYAISKLLQHSNQVIEQSFIEDLIERLVVGYEFVHYLKKRIEHYQIHKGLLCHHLSFVLSGLEKSYSDFLVTLDSTLINFFENVDTDITFTESKEKVTIFDQNSYVHKPWINMKLE